jgi:hypothetical protein
VLGTGAIMYMLTLHITTHAGRDALVLVLSKLGLVVGLYRIHSACLSYQLGLALIHCNLEV